MLNNDGEYWRELFESITTYSENAILSKDLDGTITSWNHGAEKLFGYSEQEAIGKSISIILPMDRIDEEREIIEKIRNGQCINDMETERLRKDGSRVNISVSISPIKNKNGDIIGVSKIAHDISQYKLNDGNLQKSLKETADYKYALDESSIVAITDQKGVINYVNNYFCKISKYQREELIGQDHRIVNSGYHPASYIRDMWVTIANGNIWKGQLKNKAKDGTYYWVDTTIVPFLNEHGKPYQYLSIRSDITKRKELELQERKITADLIQRNNDLEQFAYIVSHNLRGPVATISGISNCIKDETLGEVERNFFIDGLAESVIKLDNVIIDLNQVINTKSSINEKKELVYFSQILNDFISGNQGIIDDKLMSIKSDFTAADSIVTIRHYMYSIFYNLISNSIKYRRPGVFLAVEVKSRKVMNKVELLFRDNGMGIDLQRKSDQIFGLYKRFHISAAEGKGMGLFMVKTQVETLGGRISIESEVNIGTQFRIEFELPEVTASKQRVK